MTDLDELLLQLVDWQTLPLLQDGELGLLSIRGLVASKSMLLPLWDVIGHHANASHVGCNLPTISCKREKHSLYNTPYRSPKWSQTQRFHPFSRDNPRIMRYSRHYLDKIKFCDLFTHHHCPHVTRRPFSSCSRPSFKAS